jgi:membrane protease YdiL (CAAX protease family)
LEQNATLTPAPEPILAASPVPAEPSTLRKIFVGQDGLRAGWSLLIFIAVFAAIVFCVNFVGHKLFPSAIKPPKQGEEGSPAFLFIAESIPFIITAFVTWIMAKIERRPSSAYGLSGKHRVKYFFAGLAWGILFLSLLIAALWKSGLLVIDHRLLFGRDILRYGAIWLLGFLLVGMLEEYLTRGYLQYTLTRGLAGIYRWIFKTQHSVAFGFWTSAILFSILFGLGHGKNPGESPIGLLSAGLAAMVFCFSLWRTGSLWWAIGFHTSWDWGQSFLYGVADSGAMVQHHLLATHPVGKAVLSGGTTGPEGSIFIIAILALASLTIVLTLPRAEHGETYAPLSVPAR